MKKYKTLKQELEERINKFDGSLEEKKSYGEKIDIKLDSFSITSFIPTGNCNLFHQKDIANILIDLNIPFFLNYWSTDGRNYFCQFTITLKKTHYIEVFASGYGLGEVLYLSKKFPEKLKFKLMREMCLSYFDDCRKDSIDYEVIYDLIYDFVTNIQDLYDITEFISLYLNKNFYKKKEKDKRFINIYLDFKKRWKKVSKSIWYSRFKAIKRRKKLELKI